ncbi:MAG: glycerol kinase GlpK [Candidatus Margulisiibacteriota bacterium]
MYILAIDQGTTGTTAVLYNQLGEIAGKAYKEFTQYYPQPGWVEHDPLEIWQTVVETVEELTRNNPGKIRAVGITNQRETTVIWDRKTGEPIHNAIVWQCRRTADICESFKDSAPMINEKTGLPLDAYFSATKIKWLLENTDHADVKDLAFGTIDTWLIWKLTGGWTHATDYTNASRTMLLNIETKEWDDELLSLFSIPRSLLPKLKKSIDDYSTVETIAPIKGVPIFAAAGDQQAALFGQTCFNAGEAKNTYGTGSFVVMNTGQELVRSTRGLVTTLASDGNGNPCYALEGSVFIAGAAIQWLRDELKILGKASDSEAMARSVADNGGVYLVPAFVGLGAPHWDMQARGTICGLTRGANRNHIARAALEAMAYQSYDVLKVMEEETGISINNLMVDGGAAANEFLMQFQADIIGCSVLRPRVIETTSMGVAMMAGLKAGLWQSSAEMAVLKAADRAFEPAMDSEQRAKLLEGWHKALRQAKTQ